MAIAPLQVSVDLNDLIKQLVGFATDLKDHLGLLVSIPARARQQLDEVLAQIDKTFTAVDDVVQEHLKVSLDPSLIETSPDLMLHLAGPELPLRIKKDRAHCHDIQGIYLSYLKGLLDPLFTNPQARAAVEQIFDRLGSADGDVFSLFEEVGTSLQKRAKQVLALQVNNDIADAKALLKSDAATLIDMRQRLQDAHLTLVGIRNDFIKDMAPPP